MSSEALHDFRETLIKAPSLNQIFDPKIADLQKQEASAAAKNLTHAKGIYDIKRLRAGVWLLDEAVSKSLAKFDPKPEIVFSGGGGEVAWLTRFVAAKAGNQPAPVTPILLSPPLEKQAQEGEKTLRQIGRTPGCHRTGSTRKRHKCAFEQQLREIKGAVTHGFQSIVDKLGDLPARTDIQKLDQTLGQKLDRIATVLEKLPLRSNVTLNKPAAEGGAIRDNLFPAPDAGEFYSEGVLAFRRGSLPKALDWFRRSVELEPDGRASLVLSGDRRIESRLHGGGHILNRSSRSAGQPRESQSRRFEPGRRNRARPDPRGAERLLEMAPLRIRSARAERITRRPEGLSSTPIASQRADAGLISMSFATEFE